MNQDEEKKRKQETLDRQKRALQDFFRDTGGKITDIRVLKSAMYLSDEIDRAVRGLDQENQFIGWRQYNRFYAEGTEDLFTNIPTGRSPLVLAAPKTPKGTVFSPVGQDVPLAIEYQSNRRSHLKQIGRDLDEIEKTERTRLEGHTSMRDEEQGSILKLEKMYYQPKSTPVEYTSSDMNVSVTQPFQQKSIHSQKESILKFEGEITDRRPDK